MGNPKVIITGLTHSGSTFLIDIFKELGVDIGSENQWIEWSPKHGREFGPFVNICREIAMLVSPKYNPPMDMKIDPNKIFHPVVNETIDQYIQGTDFPDVVKFPNEGWIWLLELFNPDHVIVTIRKPTGWLNSMNRWDENSLEVHGHSHTLTHDIDKFESYASVLGHTFASLELNQIPYDTIEYPRSAMDALYLADIIIPIIQSMGYDIEYIDFFNIYDEVVKREWIVNV